MSDKEKLREYLNTRRQFWPYEDSYHVDKMGAHRFMAKIGDELAGLSYAEITDERADGVEEVHEQEGKHHNIEVEVESQDLDTVRFVWRRK